ncbi:tyrosine-type recombinase/integrase [Legionella pneumophila]|uniref:tyrosine-type recombinase/integrase n=1 Tax=Legionella pneumophila TaxID=446 RepID=UPI0007780BAF|nr:tyrosine-type recombinase/integrase [Legionella pneumophila]
MIDKISHPLYVHFYTNSLSYLLTYYYSVHVKGAPEKTEQAKMKDLAKFINFFQMEIGYDLVDSWTPAVSKHFQKHLCKTISEKTGKPYKATSINRTMATIRHVGCWLHQQHPLLAGDPFPQESRAYLDQHLETRGAQEEEPLFITRYGSRIQTQDVYRICQRVLKQAHAFLPEQEQFDFNPHKLRHTFLKKVTDKHGVHFAQELSGNVSIKEIFRYAKPSQDEMQSTIEASFEN